MDADRIPHRAFAKARAVDEIALSQAVFDEVLAVLHRPGLARFVKPELRDNLVDRLISGAIWFEPTSGVADCRDPADNKYLDLALASGAAMIVSSDADLLVLDPWRGVRVLPPALYLAHG